MTKIDLQRKMLLYQKRSLKDNFLSSSFVQQTMWPQPLMATKIFTELFFVAIVVVVVVVVSEKKDYELLFLF